MNNLQIMLLDVNYIKERSVIMSNIEEHFIASHILAAQDIHIQDLLGSSLYEAMINDFDVLAQTFSHTKYITLNENYVQLCLLYYTLYESIDDIYAKFTNKSVVTQNSDQSTVISEQYLAKRKDDFLNKAKYYAARLTNFLINQQSTYPEFLTDSGDINADTEAPYLNNGWYLKGTGISTNNASSYTPQPVLDDIFATESWCLANFYTTAQTYSISQVYNTGQTYTQAQVNTLIASGGTFDPSNYYVKSELYNTGETYTQAESNSLFATNTNFNSHTGDSSIHFTKASIMLDDLGDVNTGGTISGYYLSYNGTGWVGVADSTDLSNYYNKTQTNANFVSGLTLTTNYYNKTQTDANFVSGLTLTTNYYNKTQVYNTGETYTQAEIIQLITGATSGITVDLTNYYNKTQSNANFLSANTYIPNDANFLSANTSFYTQSQSNANFLSANTSFYTQTQTDANFVSGLTLTTNYYNKTQSDANFLSANTSYYTQAQTNGLLELRSKTGHTHTEYLSTATTFATSMSGLTDVTIASLAQEDFLVYSGTSWKNMSVAVDLRGYYTSAQCNAYFLSANTSFYTQAQSNANFLSANTSFYTQTQANNNFLSANTSFYTQAQSNANFTSGLSFRTHTADTSIHFTLASIQANFLSANTSYYTQAQSNANFLSANTSYYTQTAANANFLSANTSYYTQAAANANFLSANTSYYTQAVTNSSFLSARTFEQSDFEIEFVVTSAYTLCPYAYYAFDIIGMYLESNVATCTVTISGDTAVTGLIGITGGTAGALWTASSNNSVSAGAKMKMQVTAATSNATVRGSIKLQRK